MEIVTKHSEEVEKVEGYQIKVGDNKETLIFKSKEEAFGFLCAEKLAALKILPTDQGGIPQHVWFQLIVRQGKRVYDILKEYYDGETKDS